MVAVKYDDLISAFEFVGAAAPTEHSAYISLDTGTIYWTSEFADRLDDDVPEDLEVSDRYVAIPHKTDLDLGRNLALRFVAQQLPDRYTQVNGFFRRQGAYSRFKDLLESCGVLDEWYGFEADAPEQALRRWCAETGIEPQNT
ncbi:hypothetical protein [Caballeronia sp. dw_19]|uniref:hypothetical protein n=1 Tax=Caballeronia sp. dw_19 TaxID=2719791 RepID=UPI001BD64EBD|nr:hypothetical protein [Caballeronia sp. dw_19]